MTTRALLMCGLTAGWLTGAAEAAVAPPAWQPIHGIPESRLITLAVDPLDGRRLYAASPRALYASSDGGRQWRRQFRTPADAQITAIALPPSDRQQVWVTTTHGLYRTTDGGRHWGRVFGGAGLGSSACDSLLLHPTKPQDIFVGTATGVFRSRDGGRQWQRLDGPAAAGSIRALAIPAQDPNRLYLMTDHALFAVGLADSQWQALFRLTSAAETAEEVDEPPEEPPEDTAASDQLTALAIDPHDHHRLFLGSSAGVYLSDDAGATWHRASQLGFGASQIIHLALQASPTIAYVATANGVGRYHAEDQRWEALYAGLPTRAVQYLGAAEHTIYAATDRGLYALDLTEEQLAQGAWPDTRNLLEHFVREPTVEQVRQTAIAYADVDPGKILHWRRQARWRAIVPKLSLTADTNLTDFRHWDSGTNPDALQRGERDIDWSANVDWELADLIWSTDQTSIDVRSRLMVELRDDILNDVTRTFFERRRLQLELLTEPPADPHTRLDKALRIQELTALLDGQTGGWFSRELHRDGAW